MSKLYKIILILLVVITSSEAYSLSLNDSIPVRSRVLIGQIKVGGKAKEITDTKIEAALSLAAYISNRYTIISLTDRDSVAYTLKSKGIEPKITNIAKELKADEVFFVSVNRLENILRMDITSVNIVKPDKKLSGLGYGYINFKIGDDEKNIYDPTLLVAAQRALAVVSDNPDLFSHLSGKLKVVPAKPLVVTGIEYIDDPTLNKWELFYSKVVTSFDAVETIFNTTRVCNDYVVYDILTRDSLYAIFNAYLVENYNAPTQFEIQSLQKFGIDQYITGYLRRINTGAELNLKLFKIGENQVDMISSVTGEFNDDSVEKMRSLIAELTRKLLHIEKIEKSDK